MAFENRTGGKYITIMGGKFVVRTNEGAKGAVTRVNKEGRTVHEMHYDSFTAKLVNIRTKDSNYGKQWEFDFRDGDELYTLQLNYSNSYALAILKMLPNVDLTQEMKVQPDQKIVDGKTKSSLFISQNGVTLKHAYTRENPNGLPDMEQKTVRGQTVWDDTERLAFLENMVQTQIIPNLPADSGVSASRNDDAEDVDDVFGSPEASDDDDF